MSKSSREILAENLKYFREKKNLSPEELSDLAFISENTYLALENPVRDFYFGTLVRVAEALEVDIYLLVMEIFTKKERVN